MRLADRFLVFALVAYAGLELVSLSAFGNTTVSFLLLAGIGLTVVAATFKNTAWGVYTVLGELFVGGKGYVLAAPVGDAMLSLRMVIFLAVFGTWLTKFCTQAFNQGARQPVFSVKIIAPASLALMIALGMANGFVRHPFHQVFYDGNAWLFFLLLPAIRTALRTPLRIHRVTQLLLAATFIVGLKTALLLFLFGHFPQDTLVWVYQWIRGTGVGEITPVAGRLFRIFFQSHVFAMVSWLSLLSLLLQRSVRYRTDIIIVSAGLYLAGLTVLTSQSRSLWIGTAAGLAVLMVVAVKNSQLKISQAVVIALLLAYVTSTQFSAVALLSGNFTGNVLADRFSNLSSEPAASSRKSQWQPLTAAISLRPWLGWGFGKELSYRSQDPRVVQQHPDGWYTTAAFEWGYFDIALKIGLIGLMAYLAWIIQLVSAGLHRKSQPAAITGITIGLFAIAATNVFSPYLNHPLGIGWMLFTVAAVNLGRATLAEPATRK